MHFTIPPDHPSLPGHFPGNPVVPGVVVMDRVLDAFEAETGMNVSALRLPQVKFMQPLLPGQTARVSLEGSDSKWRFRVHHDDRLIASGDLVLMVETT